MDVLAKVVLGLVVFWAILILGVTLGPLIGGFSGLVVEFFWPVTSLEVRTLLGVADLALWQIGAALGFVGGFFRSAFSTQQKE